MLIASLVVCALTTPAFSQLGYVQSAKLVGSGAVGTASQGSSTELSADGSTLAVGGWIDDSNVGATWVFTRSANGTFVQQGAKLVGSGAVGPASQGSSTELSADGRTLAVGGPFDNSNVGATWVFTRSANGTFVQQGAKLIGSGAVGPAYQGRSTALSADGRTLAVGGPFDDSNVGATWVFTRSANGTFVQQGAKLVGSGAVGPAYQGRSTALSADGRTLAVGGPFDDSNVGATWVFTRSANGTFVQQGAKLVGSGAVGTATQGYATALSADGSTLAVGGDYDDGSIGATWVFARAANGTYVQQGAKLVGSGAVGRAQQGWSTALSANGSTLAVGGYYDDGSIGATWVFARAANGTYVQQGAKLVGGGAVGRAQQGWSTALSANGSTLAVCGHHDDSDVGATWIFEGGLVPGAPCQSDQSCLYKKCSAGYCLNLPGAPCTKNTECLSLNCTRGTCQCDAACDVPICGGCEASYACIAGTCALSSPALSPGPPVGGSSVGALQPISPPAGAGLIAGTVVGGVAVLILLLAAAVLLCRRARRRAHAPGSTNVSDAPGDFQSTAFKSDMTPSTPFSRSSYAPSVLTQRDTLDNKDDRKQLLLRQLRHVYRTNATILNTYKLLGDSGYHQRVGGQGVVQFACIAWDKDRQFALKFFLDDQSFATERSHFTNQSLQHVLPDVRAVEGNEDGSLQVLGRPLPPFVVTERGESLDEWARRTNINADLNFANAMQIVLHLVQRVSELHALNLVHRDLKPGNVILLPSRNEWTVIDFGSAAPSGSTAPMSISVAYAAPETVLAWADGQRTVVADPAVDVWALGMIAFELLTLTPNYSHGRDMVVQTMKGKLLLPWENVDDVEYAQNLQRLGFMKGMVLSMLARDPKERPSLIDVQSEFNSYFKRGSLQARTESSSQDGLGMGMGGGNSGN